MYSISMDALRLAFRQEANAMDEANTIGATDTVNDTSSEWKISCNLSQ